MFFKLKLLPTATKVIILKLDAESKITFCKGAVKLLEVLISKLQEQSPLKSLLERCFSWLSPATKVSEKKVLNVKFGKIVDRHYQSKHSSSSQADNAKCQYNDLLQFVCVIHQ